MPDPTLTDEELETLRRLHAEATDGKWAIDDEGNWRAFERDDGPLYVGEFDGSQFDERFVLALHYLANRAGQQSAALGERERKVVEAAKRWRRARTGDGAPLNDQSDSRVALEAAVDALGKGEG